MAVTMDSRSSIQPAHKRPFQNMCVSAEDIELENVTVSAIVPEAIEIIVLAMSSRAFQ